MSQVIQSQIQTWREKCLAGTITQEEMREAIAAIRKERVGAAGVSAASTERKTTAKAKAKAAPINSDDLLAGL